MFLFPWLDWGIDISDFEKIDLLGHGRFLAFSAPCRSDFLTWAIILRGPLKVPRVKILKNFFHTALFFLLNSLSVADAKNEPAQGLGTPQNGP